MDRKDLRALSRVRLSEASALLKAGLPDGAYYLAGYAVECAHRQGDQSVFRKYWDIVQSWSEQSRYGRHSLESAQALIEAIGERNHGVMKWVRHYW
jgi:hypothetical protein